MGGVMRLLLAVTIIGLFSSPAFAQGAQSQQKSGTPAASGEKVSGTACVRAGVEAGCVMLATTDGTHTYNIVEGKKPTVGAVVKFTGMTKPGTVTTCQQGTPIRLATSMAVKMKCP